MIRSVLTLVALAICVGCFLLATNGTAISQEALRRPTRKPAAPPTPSAVLMIGDSLSAGPFGRAVQEHLEQRNFRVAAYASCGSSPEHWLADEPIFVTKCGYRESTAPGRETMIDFVDGRPPAPRSTPKLEKLLAQHEPDTVIIQLGTNWMDRNLSEEKMRWFLDRVMQTARGRDRRNVIWITPPDSVAFAKVQGRYQTLIKTGARRHGVEIIDSTGFTQYIRGKTGGDGIHYNTASSLAWANGVNSRLDRALGRGGSRIATRLGDETGSTSSRR